jgi:hypothetical protein
MISTTTELYEIAEHAISECRKHGYDGVAQKLDDAMHLGSSGLEILGAIRAVCTSNEGTLVKVIGQDQVDEIVHYVNKAYGVPGT